MEPAARFDDHTRGREHAFSLTGLRDTVVAHIPEEVVPAIARVEAACRTGLWAGGFVSFEAAPGFDRVLTVRRPEGSNPFAELPLVWFGLFERREPVDNFVARERGPTPYHLSSWTPDIDRGQYESAVAAVRDRIAKGDIHQANLTFRLRAAFSGNPDEFYRDLVLAQRGAYSAWFDLGRYRVLCASPERFFRLVGGRIEVRPMKGTMRRGRWPEEDDRMAAELLASEKERAENLMIVDLIMNDLGQVAEAASVEVDELLTLERYETLWHLTSNMSATLADGIGVAGIFRRLFPSGSVTGAPKAPTMQILRDLEASPRGVYCGATGFVAPPSSDVAADFAVAIRTVAVDLEEGVAEYGTGGAITRDSKAEAEYQEAWLKARLLVERRPEFELFETLRWDPVGGYRYREEHMNRLERSAYYFGFAFDRQVVEEELDKQASGIQDSYGLRLLLRRSGSVGAERRPIEGSFVTEPEGAEVIELAVSDWPVNSNDVFLFHQTSRRRGYDRRVAARPEVDDVLLVNERGEITETTVGNVVVRDARGWWTPPLDSGCLPGVYRKVLLDSGLIRERVVHGGELPVAGGVAVINSVRGWRRAVLAT